MFCRDDHLGFTIQINNIYYVKDHPIIIHVQFGLMKFREQIFIYFPTRSKIKLCPVVTAILDFWSAQKSKILCEDHPRIIHTILNFKPLSRFWIIKHQGSANQYVLLAPIAMLNFALSTISQILMRSTSLSTFFSFGLVISEKKMFTYDDRCKVVMIALMVFCSWWTPYQPFTILYQYHD